MRCTPRQQNPNPGTWKVSLLSLSLDSGRGSSRIENDSVKKSHTQYAYALTGSFGDALGYLIRKYKLALLHNRLVRDTPKRKIYQIRKNDKAVKEIQNQHFSSFLKWE